MEFVLVLCINHLIEKTVMPPGVITFRKWWFIQLAVYLDTWLMAYPYNNFHGDQTLLIESFISPQSESFISHLQAQQLYFLSMSVSKLMESFSYPTKIPLVDSSLNKTPL